MSKPEALSIPNNTYMTRNISYHPLPVSRIKQDENMQAVDRSETVFALPCGIFYSVPLAAFSNSVESSSIFNASLFMCISIVFTSENSCPCGYLLPSNNIYLFILFRWRISFPRNTQICQFIVTNSNCDIFKSKALTTIFKACTFKFKE